MIVAKGIESMKNIRSYPALKEFWDLEGKPGLVYMTMEFYGYEVKPVSRDKVNIRALYHIDP